ncbi:MAG TPA: rRNA maturation RNase YbeY [Gaiellaceae bacterium]|jgi:probable rRNA maturation factor|nr:rRNA maturation RNase YbeY [Gaiellaceae bacterium]
MVEIEVANRSAAALDLEAAAQLIRDVLREEGIDEGELGLALVGPDEIRDLKHEHLGIDEETDALAFPIDGRETIPVGLPRQLGDVVICPEVVGDAWRGPLVHAVLHLVGYDHGAKMEARERAHV